MAIKEHDFVEVDYTGRVKDTNEVFDTTDISEAKKQGIYHEELVLGPVTACIGEGVILHGLEKKLVGLELGEHDLEVSPEEGFGKKSAKLIQLIQTTKFKKQDVVPVPGLQVNIDGMLGTIRTVTGGRTIVDFNHQLAGKSLIYHVNLKRIVTDEEEKARALLKWYFRIEPKSLEVDQKGLTVTLGKGIPSSYHEEIRKKILELTAFSAVTFKEQ